MPVSTASAVRVCLCLAFFAALACSETSVPASCVTRRDPRVRAWVATTAKDGTHCVFGADARDEGKHCIPELKYGTNGWCYTRLDQSEWGSCGGGCPLYGPPKVLGKELDGVRSKINGVNANLTKLAADMPKPGHATSVAQTDSRSQTTATRLQVDVAAAFAQKASRQTKLWTNLAEKVLKMDDDDSLSMADEALTKAIAWQNIANRAGARINSHRVPSLVEKRRKVGHSDLAALGAAYGNVHSLLDRHEAISDRMLRDGRHFGHDVKEAHSNIGKALTKLRQSSEYLIDIAATEGSHAAMHAALLQLEVPANDLKKGLDHLEGMVNEADRAAEAA